VEESIVSIHHLHHWILKDDNNSDNSSSHPLILSTNTEPGPASTASSRPQKPFIVVDVCGGEGLFSMLLSYMASEFWYAPPPPPPSSTAITPNSMQEDIPTPRPSRLLQQQTMGSKQKLSRVA
jgi:hypothetical protein